VKWVNCSGCANQRRNWRFSRGIESRPRRNIRCIISKWVDLCNLVLLVSLRSSSNMGSLWATNLYQSTANRSITLTTSRRISAPCSYSLNSRTRANLIKTCIVVVASRLRLNTHGILLSSSRFLVIARTSRLDSTRAHATYATPFLWTKRPRSSNLTLILLSWSSSRNISSSYEANKKRPNASSTRNPKTTQNSYPN